MHIHWLVSNLPCLGLCRPVQDLGCMFENAIQFNPCEKSKFQNLPLRFLETLISLDICNLQIEEQIRATQAATCSFLSSRNFRTSNNLTFFLKISPYIVLTSSFILPDLPLLLVSATP